MSQYRDAGLFVFTSAVFGSAFVAIEVGVAVVPPVLLAALRYDITAVVLLVLGAHSCDTWRPKTRPDFLAVLFGGVFLIAGNNALLFLGQQYTTSAVAAVTHSLNPILTMLVAYLVLSTTRPSPGDVLGIFLGLGGVAAIARPTTSNLVQGSPGIVLIFLAALSVAIGSVALRWLDSSLSSVPMTGWASGVGAFIMHVVSLGIDGSLTTVSWTPAAIFALFFLAIPGGVIAYGGYFYLIERIGPTQSNLISYAAPLFAAVSGWLLLDQAVRLPTLVGLLLIFSGFTLVKRDAIVAELGI